MTQNPITQGIVLNQQVTNWTTLRAAIMALDATTDPELQTLLTQADIQLARYKAELTALINLYGG